MLELPNDEINYYRLKQINKWTFEEISEFIKMKENVNKEEFIECLNTIYEYNLSFNQITSLNKENLHQIGIKKFYKFTYSRNIDELINEHELILKEKEMPLNLKNKDCLISQRVKKIKELTNYYSNTKITKENINQSMNIVLKSKDDDLIAIVNNGVKKIFGYHLRDSQIYSLLVLLD